MARRHARPSARYQLRLTPLDDHCSTCGERLWVAYHNRRVVLRLDGLCAMTLVVRRCRSPECPRYRQAYRPEAEGAVALPGSEIGLDVVALVGALRFQQHRSIPEIHQALQERGLVLAERTVTNLLYRYEELVALSLTDQHRLRERLSAQDDVVLALDGLQPDVGHEVLWVLRDCRSGAILLARSLLSGREDELVALIRSVQQSVSLPITGVVSDGQHSIRNAVATALPGVPHQLCQFHYLREAARPVYEADRHVKKELKKQVRGVRPIERVLEGQQGEEAVAGRGYCLAVRSALTDDGRPPLCASGLRLRARLQAIDASLTRVAMQKGGCRQHCGNYSASCSAA